MDGEAAISFTLTCPACHKPVLIRAEHVGISVVCPHCHKDFLPTVPKREEPENPLALDRLDKGESARCRFRAPVRVNFPISFHVAAWVLIVTCVLFLSGILTYTVRVRDTLIIPH